MPRKTYLPMENNTSDLATRCRREASRLLSRYSWSMLNVDELTERAMVHVKETSSDLSVKYACLRVYSEELHRAIFCDNWELVNLAFQELRNYLEPIANYKAGSEDMDEFVQRTQAKIWEKRSDCEQPTYFLIWAKQILIREIGQDIRKKTFRPKSDGSDESDRKRIRREIEMVIDEGEEDERPMEFPDKAPPVDNDILREEATRRFLTLLETEFRSDNQRTVIIELFLNERSPLEVAKKIGCSVSNLFLLKFRALRNLKNYPEAIEALRDIIQTFPPSTGKEFDVE